MTAADEHVQLHIVLTMDTMECLMSGEEIAIDLPKMPSEPLRVVLRLDEESAAQFRDVLDKAILSMLPTDGHKH